MRSDAQPTLFEFPLSSISLANPTSTTCYMNYSIHAVLHILALLNPQDQAELGQLCHLWGALQRRPRLFDPSRHLHWVMQMSPWRNLFTQHDAVEDMAHMLVRLRLPCLTGRWEARTMETGKDLLQDEGLLRHPIALPLQGFTSLSECAQAWCHQTHTHALAPFCHVPALGLQLMRFRARGKRAPGHRSIRKDLRPISGILDDISVPQFCNSHNLDVQHLVYQVAAVILHRGQGIDSGHYVCLWKRGLQLLLLDDANTAAPCTPADLGTLATDAYMIWYVRQAPAET